MGPSKPKPSSIERDSDNWIMCIELLIARHQALRDNAYCQYVDQFFKKDCLGFDAKIKSGEFGPLQLEAHGLANELLGKHRAEVRIVAELQELIR